ncbi:putative disease resistance protein [Vitis vinifera]|uniref:Putative disease resistance protein n=1 Tax=Vitis vinifera TaxID=29760 RepID=A0A438JAD5_VITVI|nr:putative disease resistance protein [Vitis vinifera]
MAASYGTPKDPSAGRKLSAKKKWAWASGKKSTHAWVAWAMGSNLEPKVAVNNGEAARLGTILLCTVGHRPESNDRMADLAGGAAGEIYKDGNRVATFAISNILYLKDLNRNYKKLKQEAMKLKAMRKDLEIRRFKTKSCIRDWIARASTIERQVEDLEIKYTIKEASMEIAFPCKSWQRDEVKCQEVCSHWEEGDFKKSNSSHGIARALWDWIDLNRIMGIDENLDSKVVLASRYQDICCVMDAEDLVDVKPLSHNDAWNIFQKKVGHYISNRSIEPLARGVVDECHGLPLLIDRVAKTFKKKGENEVLWKDGLKRLKRWDSVKLDGMDEVLERLQNCYDDLKDGEEKHCFLYGALYPEEREIDVDYLLECWKAEGFINDASNFRSARSRGHSY